MHHARLNKSARLQRVNRLLRSRRWHSTRDIMRKAHVCAVSAVISELRQNGKRIECKRVAHRWLYRMA
jgi:hypothetical protein